MHKAWHAGMPTENIFKRKDFQRKTSTKKVWLRLLACAVSIKPGWTSTVFCPGHKENQLIKPVDRIRASG